MCQLVISFSEGTLQHLLSESKDISAAAYCGPVHYISIIVHVLIQ